MLNMGEVKQGENPAPLAVAQPTPEVVDILSRELDVPHHMIIMGSLAHTQSFSIQDLRGAGLSGDRNQPGLSLSISLKEDFSACTNTPRPERP